MLIILVFIKYYIIIITPKNENYTKEDFTNPCFITRLVTEKKEGIQIK